MTTGVHSSPVAPTGRPDGSSEQTVQAIRRRAQELYERRGRVPGHEVEDWLQAEAEIKGETALSSDRKTAQVVVKVNGVCYTGEYDPDHCQGYRPGELVAGAPLRVRFQGDKMYIQRPNGTELETRIVRR